MHPAPIGIAAVSASWRNASVSHFLWEEVKMDEKQVKVLLIDDEPDFAQIVAFRLKSKGYIVYSAKSGQEGIELIKKENPDIVFLDLKMPQMDGWRP
jgi:response regulator RpfG family c-di-GMP phosphodiesterase